MACRGLAADIGTTNHLTPGNNRAYSDCMAVLDPPPANSSQSTIPATSPSLNKSKRDPFGRFVHITEDKFGEDLVDIKVHNPAQRFYSYIDYLKTHGDIPIFIRTKIPFFLVVLLFFSILGFTGISKIIHLASVCPTTFTTKIGRLYELTVATEPHPPLAIFGITLVGSTLPQAATRVVLVENNQTLSVKLAPGISAAGLSDQSVAVSGNFNICDSTITVSSPLNLAPVAP